MHQTEPQPEGFSRDREICSPPSTARHLSQNHSESHSRKVWNEIIPFNSARSQGRDQAINQYSGLILDLQQIQPASIFQIAEAVGQSTSATRNHLRRLMQLDLVIKTSFEHHTLYCINGRYNVHIARLLSELFE